MFMKAISKFLYVVLIIIGFSLYLGLKNIRKEGRKEKVDAITNQLFKTEKKIPGSAYYPIGSSNFKIKTPFPLKESSLKIPDAYKDRIINMQVFEFVQNPYFEGKISYIKWINSVIYDLNTGIDGTIENIRKLPGVEKIVENRKYFENSKYTAYYYDAIILRDSKSGILKGAIFMSGQETWLINFGVTESKNESIINEILESLKENE